jgi:hypothetical protein
VAVVEILPTATDLAEEALIRSSEGCRALAALLLDGPVQQLSGLALSVSAAAAAFSPEDAGQHLLLARAELLERYARLLATAADQLERIEEAPVRRLHPRWRVSQD